MTMNLGRAFNAMLKFGRNADISTVEEDIAVQGGVYTLPSAAMSASSDVWGEFDIELVKK